jgi:hypothetical protein
MSIFGSRSQSVTNVTAPVYEGYDVEANGDIIALQESFEDQLAVIEALHAIDMEEIALRSDVRTLEEGTSEYETRVQDFEAVTEALVKDAWAKIKEFFSKLWGKIKAFFATVVRVFDGIFKSGKAFVEKYENQLRKLNLNGYKVKMFKYTNLDSADFMEANPKEDSKKLFDAATKAVTSGNATELDALIEQIRDNKEKELNDFRGELLDKGSLDSDEFAKELFAGFRNGASSEADKEEEAVNIEEIIKALKDTKAKEKVDGFSKKTNEEFGKIISNIDSLHSKLGAAKEKEGSYTVKQSGAEHKVGKDVAPKVLQALQAYSSLFTGFKDITMETFRAWNTAYKERNSVYKSVATGAFRYKEKK